MESTIVTLVFGIGMFFAGWLLHAWSGAGTRESVADDGDATEVATPKTRWICPQCQRRRDLPSDLGGKVLLCNNCNVRLQRDVENP